MLKSKLRKKILKIRENINIKNIKIDFKKIINLLKKEKINEKNIGGYYPVNFEVDDLDILKELEKKILIFLYLKLRKILIWIFINGHLTNP